jgi:hypothetical protein
MSWGTLAATSTVEFDYSGGVGINSPVDATGPAKEFGFWLAQSAGLEGSLEDCYAQCQAMLPVGGAGGGGGNYSAQNWVPDVVRDNPEAVVVIVGVVGVVAGTLLRITAISTGGWAIVVIGVVSFGIRSYGWPILREYLDGVSGGGGVAGFLECVSACEYALGGPGGGSSPRRPDSGDPPNSPIVSVR